MNNDYYNRNENEDSSYRLKREDISRDDYSSGYTYRNTQSGYGGGYGYNGGNNPNGYYKKKKSLNDPVVITRKTLIIAVIICILLSGGVGLGVSKFAGSLYPYGTASYDTGSVDTKGGYKLEDATGSSKTVKQIAAENQNSIVEIYTESVATDSWMQQYITEGAGSGIIIKEDGYIVTNNHVIAGASKIKVRLSNDKEYAAALVGTDSQLDIAVIKIDAKGLDPVTYGNSDQLSVGDMAVAIGNPLGTLGGTVTAGIISAKQRTLTIEDQEMTLIQTDASINPGNSGGGLFNGSGQLCGMVVAKSSGSDVEGLGFAIPVNKVANAASQIMKNGYVSGYAYTGMAYKEASSSQDGGMSDFFGFGGGQSQTLPVYIYEVNSKEAKKAGFKSGDYVYKVDGKEIDSIATLKKVIQTHEPGDTITYVVVRDGRQLKIDLTLIEKTAGN